MEPRSLLSTLGLDGSPTNFVFLGEAGGGKSEIALNLARLLAEDGHRVHTYALSGSVVTPTENLTLADSLDGIGRADCVVLPLPVAGAEDVYKRQAYAWTSPVKWRRRLNWSPSFNVRWAEFSVPERIGILP